jgi:hypothetical protein
MSLQPQPTRTFETVEPCCPPFDPEPWQDAEITWDKKKFLKDEVPCVVYVPITMSKHMAADREKIAAAGATSKDSLVVSDALSPWRMELLLSVDKDIPGSEMAEVSGTFLTHVFDGPYRDMPRWEHHMRMLAGARALPIEKLYFAYTTCPKCAEKYGHNYVIGLAKVTKPAVGSLPA